MKFPLFLAICVFLSVSPALAQESGVFKPGDLVMIQMEAPEGAAPSPATTHVIPSEGTIQLPKLEKPISSVGISCMQLTNRINQAYQNSGIHPAPTVKTIYFGHHEIEVPVVNVGGEVNASGEFPLRKGMTLMKAISRAGGFTESAATSRVKLTRAEKEMIHDLRQINQDGSNNPILMDGDVISVPPLWGTRGSAGILKPGDGVPLVVKGPGDTAPITTLYEVSSLGTMKFPLLEKEIDAAGVTVGALILRINNSYRAAGIAAEVELSQPEAMDGRGVITVRGGVKAPGEYPLRREMTMMAAINRAGGMPGRFTKVKILRDNQESIHDLRKLNPDGSNNPILMQGDVIIVPDP